MNLFERPEKIGTEAEIEYLDGDFRIIRHGTFVRCGVSGAPISLDELRYWSVEFQEPYAGAAESLRRVRGLMAGGQ